MYNVGLVGFGRWGKILSREIKAHNRLNLISICHPSATEGCGFFFRSLDDLIAYSNPDVVVIAAPLKKRADLIRSALTANKSVLTEKPIAESAEEASMLANIAKLRNLTLYTNYVHAYSQGVSYVIDRLSDLGKLNLINIVMNQPGPTYAEEGPLSLLVSHCFAIAMRSIDGDCNLVDFSLKHCHETANKRMAYVQGYFPVHGSELQIISNIAHPLRQRSIDYILSEGTISVQLAGSASGVWTCSSSSLQDDPHIPSVQGTELDESKNICNILNNFTEALDKNELGNVKLALSVQNALEQCKAFQTQV